MLAAARGLSAQTSPPAGEPAPPLPAVADTAPVEVTVRGSRASRDIGSEDMPAGELRHIPGTFGEPFQAIASLPGVAPMASGLPYFYVRGAPPADTGYFLDGIPLPSLFHIGPGPSVVPSALIERVELFPGTAPARYGRFAGGVIAGSTTAPSTVATGEASLRLFDASAIVEVPIDAASTALVAGRYGYPNLLLGAFAPNLSLAYGDYTIRLTRKLTDADAVTLFAIGSYDQEKEKTGQLLPVDTLFHRLDLRYDHTWKNGSLRVATTLGYDRTTSTFGNTSSAFSTGLNETLTETSVRVRLEGRQRLGAAVGLSAGADASASLDRGGSANVGFDAQQVAGAYAEVDLRPSERVAMVAGVRLDAYRSSGTITPSVDPRLAVRIRVAPTVTSITTLGVAHQPPAYLLPAPGLRLDPSGGLQAAYQVAEGAEVRLPWAVTATLTGFYNADRGLNDFVSDCGSFAINCNAITRVDGRTFGVELIAQRAFSRRLAGWVSYTLSRAERRIASVSFLSPFDRTHVLSLVVRYDFGSGIQAGLRAAYNTGRPVIPSVLLDGQSIAVAFGTSAVPQHRLPSFYRIDLRAEKRWALGAGRWVAAVAEFFDATLNQEAVDFRCDLVSWRCTAQRIGPIALPSVGIEAGF